MLFKRFTHETYTNAQEAAATATTIDIIPQAAFNVLQGRNAVNDGTPSPFVSQIQASAVGKGMEPLDVAFASVNGATTCNACGFEGDVATEFIGDGACICVLRWGVVDMLTGF